MTIVEERPAPAAEPPPRRPNRPGRCCATPGGSSPACVRPWCCSSCWPSPRSRARCCRNARSTSRTSPATSGRTPISRRSWTGSASSTCTRRPGSPRSTCCCSPRWSAAWCRGCWTTCARCAPYPRMLLGGWSGCRSTRRQQTATDDPAAAAASRGRGAAQAPLPDRRPRAAGRHLDGLGREGLPQGDRQPAVPLRAARGAGRRGLRALVRLARQPPAGAGRRTRASATRSRSTTSRRSAPASTPPTCRSSACG